MPFMMQGLGTMAPGALSPQEAQQEFNKAFLANQKQMIQQTLSGLAEYQKQLKEAMTAIDEQLAKFAEVETERKKASGTQAKSSK